MTTDSREPYDEDDLNLQWSVSRVPDATSPLFAWSGSISLVEPPEDPDSGETFGDLGWITAYAAPWAADEPSTWEDFDNISLDVVTIASALCSSYRSVAEEIHERYGDVLSRGF